MNFFLEVFGNIFLEICKVNFLEVFGYIFFWRFARWEYLLFEGESEF